MMAGFEPQWKNYGEEDEKEVEDAQGTCGGKGVLAEVPGEVPWQLRRGPWN